MSGIFYQVNPDRNVPWNDLPPLPVRKELYQKIEILETLGDAKAALAKLQDRSVVIPDQILLIFSLRLFTSSVSVTEGQDAYSIYII